MITTVRLTWCDTLMSLWVLSMNRINFNVKEAAAVTGCMLWSVVKRERRRQQWRPMTAAYPTWNCPIPCRRESRPDKMMTDISWGKKFDAGRTNIGGHSCGNTWWWQRRRRWRVNLVEEVIRNGKASIGSGLVSVDGHEENHAWYPTFVLINLPNTPWYIDNDDSLIGQDSPCESNKMAHHRDRSRSM